MIEEAAEQMNSEIEELRDKAKEYERMGEQGAADECYRKIQQKQNTMARL